MKIYWLGLRVENTDEPLKDWDGDIEEYFWFWVMCNLQDGKSAISTDRQVLVDRMEYISKTHKTEVYEIFEEYI